MGKWDNDGVYRRGTRGARGQDSSSRSAHSKNNIDWGELNLGESKSGAVSQELDLAFYKGEKDASGGLRTEYALEGESSLWGAGADPQKVEEALLKMAEDSAREKEKEDSFEEVQETRELTPGEQTIHQVEALAKAFGEEASGAQEPEGEAAKSEEPEKKEESEKKEPLEEAAKKDAEEGGTPDFLKATDALLQESEQEAARQRKEAAREEPQKREEQSTSRKKAAGKKSSAFKPTYRDEADEIQLFARELDDQSAIKVMLAQEEEDDEEIFLEAEEHKEKVTAQDLDFCIELIREEPQKEEPEQAQKRERRSEKKATERVASGVKALGKKIFDKENLKDQEEEEKELQEELSEKETLSSIEEALSQDLREREDEAEEEDDDDYEVIMVMSRDNVNQALEESEEVQESEEAQESEAFEEDRKKGSEEKTENESSEEEVEWLDDEDEWDGSDYDLTIMPHFAEEEEVSDSLEDEVFEVEEIPLNKGTGKRRPQAAKSGGTQKASQAGSRKEEGSARKGTSQRTAPGGKGKEVSGSGKSESRSSGGTDRSKKPSQNSGGTMRRDARPVNVRNKVARPVPARKAALEEESKRKLRLSFHPGEFFSKTSGFMLGLAFLILGTVYATVAYYYADHFIPGTVINGVEVGGLTAYEAEKKLANELEGYSIQVASRNFEPQTIMGSSIDYKYLSDGEVLSLLKGQNHLGWLPGFLFKTRYTTTKTVSYDRSLLRSQFKSLECAKEENQVSPQNAYVAMQGDKFEIIPESQGCALKLKDAYRLLDQAIVSGEDSIDFTSEDLYEAPTLFSDSPEMFTMLDAFNNYATAKITYTIGTATEVLDGDILKTWLEFDSNGDLVKDADSFDAHIRQYVAELAGRYDTADTVREFKATSGRTVSVYGYGYGWILDQEAEYAQLSEEIAAGKQVTREPNWLAKGNAPAPNDIGNTYIEVDMGVQHMYYYQNGYVIFDSEIVSGNINVAGHATPEGIYTLYAKQSPAVLRGEADESGKPEYETEVSFWMPFNGGVGFHDAEWQPYFGGDLYLTNGSHGCINLPYYAAATLYDLIDYNVPIICFY